MKSAVVVADLMSPVLIIYTCMYPVAIFILFLIWHENLNHMAVTNSSMGCNDIEIQGLTMQTRVPVCMYTL